MSMVIRILLLVFVQVVLHVVIAAVPASLLSWTSTATAQGIDEDDWLEPRGLNIVDLVGQVPEQYLQDAIVSFVGGAGISQYESGIRNGDIVTVTYRVTPNYQSAGTPVTLASCPSYQGFSDHWPVPMPAASTRFFAGSNEITQFVYAIRYHPSGLFKPQFGATTDRYHSVTPTVLAFDSNGALEVPANMGCTLFFQGTHTDVRAVYIYNQPQQIRIELLGLDVFEFQSYIGPGEAGWIASLQEQMAVYGLRHDKFLLLPPPKTDYVFVTFPPTPVGPYVAGEIETNIRLPSSGTYRLASGIVKLSTDHYVSFGMPLQGQWQDADQAGFLYLSRLTGINILAAPEYFVPVGIEYDSCMRYGACPPELLDRIFNATMHLSIYYLSVDRMVPDLLRYPLRQVGPGWESESEFVVRARQFETLPQTLEPPPYSLHLPVIHFDGERVPDDPTGCPCGWFDTNGRMYDFIPRLE